MKRQEVNMLNWCIYCRTPFDFLLIGNAEKHPRLGTYVFVAQTSVLCDVKIENDVLYFGTRNTVYTCPLKYLDIACLTKMIETYRYKEDTILYMLEESINDKELTEFAELNPIIETILELYTEKDDVSYLTKHIKELIAVGKEELDTYKNNMITKLKEVVSEYDNSIYIEVSNLTHGNILAYNIDGNIGIIEPEQHYDDEFYEVLYQNDVLSFCYRNQMGTMIPTEISENIKQVVLKNTKGYEIFYKDKRINPDELVVI